jgi:AraC family transcriptional regulator, regulatory protein of adaptative response / methylated-DNA-[protein]-cysteine methyltransferase
MPHPRAVTRTRGCREAPCPHWERRPLAGAAEPGKMPARLALEKSGCAVYGNSMKSESQIRYAFERTRLGRLLVAANGHGVCNISIGNNTTELRAALRSRFPHARLLEDAPSLRPHLQRLSRYLENSSPRLSLPLDISGTAFQRKVWKALRRIPFGETATYQEIARRIRAPRAVRAVANACAANRLALAIPCHRVVRADGSLGGYRWGQNRKRALIEAERAAKD